MKPAVCHIWKLLGESILRVLITRKTVFFLFLLFCICMRWWMLTELTVVIISWSVCQIITLCTLNLYGAGYQLYLNKTGREKYFIAKKCQNNYNSNIKDHWSQITIISITVMKKFWNIARIAKIWQRDTKWANAFGKIAPMHGGHKPPICKKCRIHEAQ